MFCLSDRNSGSLSGPHRFSSAIRGSFSSSSSATSGFWIQPNLAALWSMIAMHAIITSIGFYSDLSKDLVICKFSVLQGRRIQSVRPACQCLLAAKKSEFSKNDHQGNPGERVLKIIVTPSLDFGSFWGMHTRSVTHCYCHWTSRHQYQIQEAVAIILRQIEWGQVAGRILHIQNQKSSGNIFSCDEKSSMSIIV